jgi:2-polyprenyl-3-methyl-5-hydroxy-6-metoxy-1,4-benzoquinol methylase
MFFAFGVVEHFSNATEVIRKWTEHLSPNGFAVLTVPNLLNAIYTSNRVNLPLEKILYEDEVVEESYGFEQLWSHNMFIRKVIDAGLEILLFRVIDELETEKPLLIVAFKRLKRGEKLGI